MDNHLIGVPITKENIQEFVDVDPKTKCFNWKYTTAKGRAHRKYNGKMTYVSRIVFALFNGPFDKALSVLHTCDNPKCINPVHLWLGTPKDNTQDCIIKGRFNTESLNLSPEDIRQIKKSYSKGASLRVIARARMISKSTVHRIVNSEQQMGQMKELFG